ncbi:MAG: Spy/CpxP family protein refolding chaperone [Candidatus Omnitrophica bacterium]|nr:Spy/CpxP family protein refolding chaperone [Candidatus Omnitrophota bacterium]
MKKVLCAALVAMMVCAATVEAGSCGKGGGKGKDDWASKVMMKAHCLVMHQEELKLSDDQVAKIKDLKYNTKKALISKKAEIELVMVDIKRATWQDEIDVAAVNALIDKKYALKNEKAKMLVAAQAQLQSILTAEQKQELKQLKKQIKCKA